MDIYYVVWQYEAKPGKAAEFEKAYSKSGPWFSFFETSDDFLGLELIKDMANGSYLVIDRWISESAYQDFLKKNESEYKKLSNELSNLHQSENKMGCYVSIRA